MRYLILSYVLLLSQPLYAWGPPEEYADITQVALPAGAFAGSLAARDWEGAAQIGASIGVAYGFAQLLKFTLDCRRPCGGHDAFPSGHTTLAFSGASALHHRYGWQYGLPAYLLAGGVAWSRVHTRYHCWRDVIAGAAIAQLVSYILVDPRDESVTLLPYVDWQKRKLGLITWRSF